jgi:hypothetical protein
LPGAIPADTFTGAGAGAGVAVGRAGGRVGVAATTAGAAWVSVAALPAEACVSRRDAADVHPPSSPDPPASAASVVSARLRVRMAAAGRPVIPTPQTLGSRARRQAGGAKIAVHRASLPSPTSADGADPLPTTGRDERPAAR